MSRWIVALAVLAGCVSFHGPVGVLAPSADIVGTKLLRPHAVGRSCRTQLFGLPWGAGAPKLDEALATILAQDEEGDVVLNAEVRSSALVTGVYNRRCLEIRGDLARAVPTITVPGPAEHRGHGAHH
jgi:hypothetical protein